MPRPTRLTPDTARALVEYNRAVFEAFVRRVRRLPARAAQRRRGIGHETVFDTLVHILNVQEVWLVYIVHGRNSDAELETLFGDDRRHPKDWKGFETYAKRVWAGVEATARAATPKFLARRTSVFWMPGRYTVGDAFLQTTVEEAHHLGEVIAALWQDGTAPPEMTWMGRRRSVR